MSKKGVKKPAMAATLEEIMRMLMEERAQREAAMERHEQQQMTTMHQHMESLLQVVNESTAKTKSQPHLPWTLNWSHCQRRMTLRHTL